MRRLLLVGTLVVTLIAGAAPARAASLDWSDKADDATSGGLHSSDAAYDIVKVTINSAGGRLKWTQQIKKMTDGNPPVSVGYFFTFSFTVNGSVYDLRIRDDVVGKSAAIRKAGTGNQDLPCKDCKFTMERKGGIVTADFAISSLAEAIKAADAKATFGPGTQITALTAGSFRSLGGVFYRADDAPAPEGASFTI